MTEGDALRRVPVDVASDCPLAHALAGRLRLAASDLVARWLERITARVDLDANRVFPSEDLLDHVPLLIDSIAHYMEEPTEEVSGDGPLLAKAMELGALRHEQGFEVYEILKEYEILGNIVFHHLIEIIDGIDEPCARGELLACGQRLFRAVAIIQQVTAIQYMRLAHQNVTEREERLRGFNRALSHEVRSRLGTLRGAVEMMAEDFVLRDDVLRGRYRDMAVENLESIERTTQNLIELSGVEGEARQHRNVYLAESIFEVTRQLRHYAEARGVTVRKSGDVPRIEVPASAVELALTNYLSNAIKYHDPEKAERWAEIRAFTQVNPDTGSRELVVAVVDNGRGVPSAARERLFSRFFRAHADVAPEVEGSGLGLSLVRETIESLGGRTWSDLDGRDTVFAFAIPGRRIGDR